MAVDVSDWFRATISSLAERWLWITRTCPSYKRCVPMLGQLFSGS